MKMNVQVIPVKMMAHVMMRSMATVVNVKQDTLEKHALIVNII